MGIRLLLAYFAMTSVTLPIAGARQDRSSGKY